MALPAKHRKAVPPHRDAPAYLPRIFAVQSLRGPLKAKLLELWTAVSPAAGEVFDLVALKEVRRCAVEVQI